MLPIARRTLLADEPAGSLDSRQGGDVVNLRRDLSRREDGGS
jgi:ABC-type lipoprotein export system ATPase subunit